MIIWVKKIKSCPEKSSWAHGCSLKIAKWPTKMEKPSLRYMSLTRCKDDMRLFRWLWRHSNQNQIIEIDILIFFEGVPLLLSLLLYQLVNVLYFRSFSKPFLICLPICCFYALKKKIVQVCWVFTLMWLVLVTYFLRLSFSYSHIIPKILVIKSSGYVYCDRLCNRLLSLLMGGSN